MYYLAIVLLFVFLVLVLSALVLYSYWRFKKQTYTRERFAFVTVSMNFSLLIAVLPVLLGGNQWINLIVESVNRIFKWNIASFEVGTSDKVLLILLLVFNYAFSYIFFTKWGGTKSLRQHLQEKEREEAGLISDLKALLQNKADLSVFVPEDESIPFEVKFPKEEDLAWNIKTALYAKLLNPQIKINEVLDWHPQQRCFISEYANSGHFVGIYSVHEEPSESKLINFIDFVNNFLGKNAFHYIVFVKKGDPSMRSVTLRDIKIDVRYENEILNNLVDFTDYREYIINGFSRNEIIKGYTNTLEQIFTLPTLTIRKRAPDGSVEQTKVDDPEKFFIDWLQNNTEKRQIALLGEYGQGKSVLAHRLAYQIFTKAIDSDRIPIIIELRGKFPKHYSDIVKLFSDWSSTYNINPNALYRLHMAGKLLLVFEGFDEMELVGDYSVRLDHFKKIWEFSYPNSKIIITGRPNYFLNDNELKTILKTTETHTSHPHCEEVYIDMFDHSQISNALRNADADTRSDILELLSNKETNKSFIDLISRPALLFLTSIVWKERNLNKFKKSINSAVVIEEFIKQTYERQEQKDIKTPLTSIERSYFMLGIAVAMVKKNNYTNHIDSFSLRKIIETLLSNFPNDLTDSNIAKPANKKPIKSRYDDKYNDETILLDIRSCGILVRDLSTFDSFKFAHKSFLEYLVSFFCANSIIDYNRDVNDKIIIRTLKKVLSVDPFILNKTPEVFRFITQIISKRIDLPNDLSEEKRMQKIFDAVYPLKSVAPKLVFFFMPIFGRNIRGSLLRLVYILLFYTGFLSFIGLIVGFPNLFHHTFMSRSAIASLLIIGLIIYYVPIYLESQFQPNVARHKTKANSIIDRFLLSFFLENNEHVTDIGNINLWYQICIESGIKVDSMQEYLPEYLFDELNSYYVSIQSAGR